MRASVVLAALALLATASTPPRPAEVESVEARDGQLRLTPPVARVEAAPGVGATIPLQLVNGGERAVTVTLDVVAAGTDDDGRPLITDQVDGGARWLTLADDRVTLAPGEAARFAPAVEVPDGALGARLVAVRARLEDGTTIASFVAIDPPGSRPELDIGVTATRDGLRSTATTTLANRGDGTAVLAVRTHGRTWLGGTLAEADVEPVLVPPGGRRRLALTYRTPGVPSGARLTSVAVHVDGSEWRATSDTLPWSPAVGVAAVLVLVAATAVLLRWRTRRRDFTPPVSPSDQ